MASASLYYREVFEVLPERARDFVALYKQSYAPRLADLGLRRVAFWQASPLEGRQGGFTALWEMPDASFQATLSRALDSSVRAQVGLQTIRDQLSALLLRREGWCFSPIGQAMDLSDIRAAGLSLTTCVWTEIDVHANRIAVLDKALRSNVLRLLRGSGLTLVGVLRPQVHSIEAVALWDLKNGAADLAAYDAIVDTPEHLHWNAVATSIRSGWRAQLLEAA